MKTDKILIGIDPDVDKSGFAIKQGAHVRIESLTFFKLFEELAFYREREIKPVVYVECGFLNKGNWHTVNGGSEAMNAQIGQRTGANHETAKKIVEMCQYLGLDYVEIKPTTTKFKANFFKKMTGIKSILNQEERDAYMLIHGR